jgi:hypothetical protein
MPRITAEARNCSTRIARLKKRKMTPPTPMMNDGTW